MTTLKIFNSGEKIVLMDHYPYHLIVYSPNNPEPLVMAAVIKVTREGIVPKIVLTSNKEANLLPENPGWIYYDPAKGGTQINAPNLGQQPQPAYQQNSGPVQYEMPYQQQPAYQQNYGQVQYEMSQQGHPVYQQNTGPLPYGLQPPQLYESTTKLSSTQTQDGRAFMPGSVLRTTNSASCSSTLPGQSTSHPVDLGFGRNFYMGDNYNMGAAMRQQHRTTAWAMQQAAFNYNYGYASESVQGNLYDHAGIPPNFPNILDQIDTISNTSTGILPYQFYSSSTEHDLAYSTPSPAESPSRPTGILPYVFYSCPTSPEQDLAYSTPSPAESPSRPTGILPYVFYSSPTSPEQDLAYSTPSPAESPSRPTRIHQYQLYTSQSISPEQDQFNSTPTPESSPSCPPASSRMCRYCVVNGQPKSVYQSHYMRSKDRSMILCKYLREIVCTICGATEDRAHTTRFCPFNPFRVTSIDFGRHENTPVNDEEVQQDGDGIEAAAEVSGGVPVEEFLGLVNRAEESETAGEKKQE